MDKSAIFSLQFASRVRLFVLLFALSPVVSAAVFQLACPELDADSLRIARPPAGWMPFAAADGRASDAGIMYGAPAERMDAKPDAVARRNNELRSTWRFDDGVNLPKWVKCTYGAGGPTLSRELPADTLSCSITISRKQRQTRPGLAISCLSR